MFCLPAISMVFDENRGNFRRLKENSLTPIQAPFFHSLDVTVMCQVRVKTLKLDLTYVRKYANIVIGGMDAKD